MADPQTTIFVLMFVMISSPVFADDFLDDVRHWYLGPHLEQYGPNIPHVFDPIGDFGAVCNRKHDDTKQINAAVEAGERFSRPVALPPNCVVSNYSMDHYHFEDGTPVSQKVIQ